MSIFAQTFQDFEIIVVDDCSTDKSCEIVEKRITGGVKLELIKSKKNSGSPGTPRNIGIGISRGKYLMFVDSDDAITKTALEELYSVAEKFQVDVVHCAEYFYTTDGTISTDKKILSKTHMQSLDLVNKPTFFLNNLPDRVKNFAEGKFWTGTCNYFYRRDFLAKNEIKFPNLQIAEDVPFTFFVISLAESIVNVPICYYVYRIMPNTNSTQNLQPEELIQKRGGSIFKSLECFNKFMNRFEFFQENPNYKYAALDFSLIVSSNLPKVMELYTKIPAPQFDFLLRRELAQIEDKDFLTAYFFSRMNVFNIQLLQQQQMLQQLQK